MLLSLSRELSRISEMSCMQLYAADSSILVGSTLGTHEMGSLAIFLIKCSFDVLPRKLGHDILSRASQVFSQVCFVDIRIS